MHNYEICELIYQEKTYEVELTCAEDLLIFCKNGTHENRHIYLVKEYKNHNIAHSSTEIEKTHFGAECMRWCSYNADVDCGGYLKSNEERQKEWMQLSIEEQDDQRETIRAGKLKFENNHKCKISYYLVIDDADTNDYGDDDEEGLNNK